MKLEKKNRAEVYGYILENVNKNTLVFVEFLAGDAICL